ncbi:YrrS family protein [Bacillus timonensis]|uniref:YrrS family protein n=1 Tax=Bacillus timonensis TaxID=1033734 RepID=UPI0002886D30|nr:YrrS family protein [Bacillus timonensis]
MGYDVDKLYDGPRSERRAKRKKVNRVLNILIILVIVLIVFFGGKLIFGDKNVDESVSSNQTNQPASNEGKATQDDSEDKAKESEEDTDKTTDEQGKKETNQENKDDQKATESDENTVVTEGDPESNIVKTIVNPTWKPIGTEQAEPHTTSFQSDSADRNEMEMAASYATGFDRSDMVVWWLGRNGGNSITATVSSKTTKQVVKVYLDWVPNEGWKPTKIEELKENDSETYKNYNNNEPDENEADE